MLEIDRGVVAVMLNEAQEFKLVNMNFEENVVARWDDVRIWFGPQNLPQLEEVVAALRKLPVPEYVGDDRDQT